MEYLVLLPGLLFSLMLVEDVGDGLRFVGQRTLLLCLGPELVHHQLVRGGRCEGH